MPTRLLIWLFFIVTATPIDAQELHYDHFTIRDGLLQMQVTTLFQDSKGHLWIGTKLGASRFDGSHFKNFTIDDGLPESRIHNISEDSLGRILLLTRSGLMTVDGEETYTYPTSIFRDSRGLYDPVVKHKDSIFIYRLNNHNQLEGYYFDGKQYILKEKYFEPLLWEGIISEFRILIDHQSQTLYAGSAQRGLNAIRNGISTKIMDINHCLQWMTRGHDQQLYIAFDANFGLIKEDSVIVVQKDVIPVKNDFLEEFIVDQQGRIIYRENDSHKLVMLEKDQAFKETFNHGIITAVLLDREGSLWIGTEKGLYRNASRAIVNYVPKANGVNERIWSVSEDKNGAMLFASYDQGLQQYNDDKFTTLHAYKSIEKKVPTPMNFYMGSLRASNGDVFLPVTYKTMLRYDGNAFYETIRSVEHNVAFYVFEDPDDYSIWVGTNEGLYQLKDGQQNYWMVKPGNGKSRSITGVVKDSSNRIWIGGFNGLSMLQNNEIIHLPNTELDFPHGGNAMLRDSINNIWIGNPHGLFLYDYNGFRSIEHPLLNKLVLSLAMVGDSALLIGTITDLLMLDVRAFYKSGAVTIMHIGPDKGYHAIEPGQNGFFRDSKGYYWLTNSDRAIRIDPAQLTTNPVSPTTYIRSVSLMDDRMNWNPLSADQLKNPVFDYAKDEKNLRFEFTAVSLRDPKGTTFSHFLEGYDKGWSAPNGESYAIYTNLQPGKYTLFFKAANTDGLWSPENAFSFEINPAWHQQLWVRLAFVLFVAGMLFFGGVFAMSRRRKLQTIQNENEKKLAQYQLLSFKNQLDPHFTFNAINAIAAAVVKEDREVAYRFFVRLSSLMRRILQSSDKLTRSLEEEMAFVNDYLEIQKFRHKERFDFEIMVADDIDLTKEVPNMCIQTFVENALKHGLLPASHFGMLRVSIIKNNDYIHITIHDNGIGREKAREQATQTTGKGLIILQGYFDYFNRYNVHKMSWEITDLKDEVNRVVGTEVLIKIPTVLIESN